MICTGLQHQLALPSLAAKIFPGLASVPVSSVARSVIDTAAYEALLCSVLRLERHRGPQRISFVGGRLAFQSVATNAMQTGEGNSSTWPVGVKRPVFASMRKPTTLLESWFATRR
jgi:hypothetical protein